ncbi:ATP-binding cassette subfamily B protein [Saccharothrix saharensis]|uniref:ATP-binding cassette subfamily B protein n=1 Tax=Saccharothrix saharensis TaxID=571190 RepID=A0A543J6T3_9PSEU|nr:ABC transporter ATP-binding protein [Saccharothrix saharensis]TQM78498.1 ATP-binding cassette subfamily B protein [Saccharothrix saharensis]
MTSSDPPRGHRDPGEHALRALRRLFRPHRRHLLGALAVFVVKHSPVWLLPLVTATIVDTVVLRLPLAGMWVATGLIMFILVVNYPLHLLYVRLLHGSVRRAGTSLRSALCTRLQELSIGYHNRTSAGVLQAKVVRDVETVEQMVQQTTDSGLGAVTVLIGGLTVVGVRAPQFLPLLLVIVPLAALVVLRLRSSLRDHNEEFRQDVEHLAARVNEMTRLIPVTRAHGLEGHALRRMDATLRRVLDSGLRLDLLNGRVASLSWVFLNILGVVFLTASALVAYLGVWGITAGDVVMLSAFLTTSTTSLATLMSLAPVISKGLESVRSASEVLRTPDLEDHKGKAEVTAVRGAVEFRAVDHAYAETGRPAVRDFTLSVAPGETVALVGPSGAGKSTVLNLLIGFLRPQSGRILLDGVDMAGLDLRTYRRFISVVPQEPILFDGTVRENVAFGLPDVDDAAIRAALRDANALDFVESLPDGVETSVADRGSHLSGGQRQRLVIARALLRDPRLLILDEATSALDVESEALVQQALARLVRGRTTFVVAHRLSTVRSADRIVVMRDGAIRETGSHDELLRGGGVYARLHAG